MKKLTNEEFIEKCIKSHPEFQYDYSKTNYKGYKEYITIICPKHGKFKQLAGTHIKGGVCPKCHKENFQNKISSKLALSQEQFISRAKSIHGNKYNYNKVEYKNLATKVCIKCNCCGLEFYQIPNNHLSGSGCPNRCYKNTTEQFIEKAKKVHGDKYSYNKVEYIDSKTKVCIICPEHGEFWQTPSQHLQGRGCKDCAKKKMGPRKITQEEYLFRARQVHGDKYDYSKVVYTGIKNKINIICSKHGKFEQIAQVHLQGCGCPRCRNSRGENIVSKILENNNIKFEQHTYIGYKGRYICPDFVITLNNAKYIIEYNGEQHYKPVQKFGGQETFEKQIFRDNLLREYCSINNIKLIEIKFDMKFPEIESYILKSLNATNE